MNIMYIALHQKHTVLDIRLQLDRKTYFLSSHTSLMIPWQLAARKQRSLLGQAIGPLWDFCAPISIVVEL